MASIVILFPKRRISLLNVDVKIASKALAIRIKSVINTLIEQDQTAYVPAWFIGESIRPIEDMLEYTDQENEDGIMYTADIENAFDSAEHEFIFATSKKFNFGSHLFIGLESC